MLRNAFRDHYKGKIVAHNAGSWKKITFLEDVTEIRTA